MHDRDPRTRITSNPFYVLGLPAECTRVELEREGQKLLGMLELGLSAAKRYDTPLGPRERTASDVREAMAELRDPERRLAHELWVKSAPPPLPGAGKPVAATGAAEQAAASTAPSASSNGAAGPWPNALSKLGWGRR